MRTWAVQAAAGSPQLWSWGALQEPQPGTGGWVAWGVRQGPRQQAGVQ